MVLESIRNLVQKHPEGVRVRMVDGLVFEVPHRDSNTFGPPHTTGRARRGPRTTSFLLWEEDHFKLINASPVADASPLAGNGNGRGEGSAGKGKGTKR